MLCVSIKHLVRDYLLILINYLMVKNAGLEETQAGIKISGRNINNLRYVMTPPLWQKVKRTKESLDESERGE